MVNEGALLCLRNICQITVPEVLRNIAVAQQKQKKQYEKGKQKGVKTLKFSTRNQVLHCVMENVGCKGERCNPSGQVNQQCNVSLLRRVSIC